MKWWIERMPGALRLAAAAALVLAAPVRAQLVSTGAVQTVSGFKVPDRDENNNLKSVLYGDFARVRPDGIVEITNVRLEFYKEGAVEMTVTSPQCVYNQKEGTARSYADVEIVREGLKITGKGFWWSAKQERFEIYQKARVEIRGAQKGVESGGLP